jgi:hypothetical protein
MLSAATPGDGEAARITARLEAVTAAWKKIVAAGQESVTEKLESSSDSEVFDFIVKELGIN